MFIKKSYFIKNDLLIAFIIYGILYLNSLYLRSFLIGLVMFPLFLIVFGNWLGEKWIKKNFIENILLGCFILMSLIIVIMGIISYYELFSEKMTWLVLFLIISSCYFIDFSRTLLTGNTRLTSYFSFKILILLNNLLINTSITKFVYLLIIILFSLLLGLMGRTGISISNISDCISPFYWFILFFSFIYVYYNKTSLKYSIGMNLLFSTSMVFMILIIPILLYRNYITEDSFALLGVINNVIKNGVYGWTLSIGKIGYYAIISTISVITSAQKNVAWIHKTVAPIFFSIYGIFFTLLIINKIYKEVSSFIVLVSIFLFPISMFFSIPLGKNLAISFFIAGYFFSLDLLCKEKIIFIDIFIVLLNIFTALLLHPQYGAYTLVILFNTLCIYLYREIYSKIHLIFLKKYLITIQLRNFILFLSYIIAIFIVPLSMDIFPYLLNRPEELISFHVPTYKSIFMFLFTPYHVSSEIGINKILYLYSNYFIFIRNLFLILGILFLNRNDLSNKKNKVIFYIVFNSFVFWGTYFLLKTSVSNLPAPIKDYRFGLFIDISLMPLVYIILNEFIKYTNKFNHTINISLITLYKKSINLNLSWLLIICLIFFSELSIYTGYTYDKTMERPITFNQFGRYVVTDDKLKVMEYIQTKINGQKFCILSDNHMGKIALGVFGIREEKVNLFPLNSAGNLYRYFNDMRRNPDIYIINELMNETDSDVVFFVIGLNDWIGWQSENAYWIDDAVLKELKLIADGWKLIEDNYYIFIFYEV
ncbi:MAG: hypothetical protein ACTSQY_04610 [Candidatus Odinarchaeia archaeon]